MALPYGKMWSRRPGLIGGSFVLASLPQPPGGSGEESPLVSPMEILSRGHAIMERLMIAMESIVARLIDDPGTDVFPLNHAAVAIKEFGAAHHMADEERYLFPKLREAGVMERLIGTLEVQHDRARSITDRLITLTCTGHIDDIGQRNEIAELCMGFIVMYRAHAAREETVLFPAFYEVATENYVDNIGMRMRDEERTLMGDPGLRKLMDNLHRIEAKAGTAELARFTP
jgi:hemerythrin-like domain-containing protein